MTIRVGVVGAGLVAQAVHLPLLQRLSDSFRVVALAEPDRRTRERVVARHAIPDAFPDHQALLAADVVDGLLVCSPDRTHAAVVLDAIAAGCHVLVEKPLCTNVTDARRIVAARDAAGVVVQVGYMKRFDPAVESLLADLERSEPPLHIATATFDPGLRGAFGPPGLSAGEASVNAFNGALVHDVNLVRAALRACGSEIERVLDGFGDDSTRAGGTIAVRGGARWTALWLGLPAAGTFREHLAFYMRDGIRELEFPAPYILQAPTTYSYTRAGSRTVKTGWREAYELQLLHFHACVTGGERCRTPPEDAFEDLQLLASLMELSR